MQFFVLSKHKKKSIKWV